MISPVAVNTTKPIKKASTSSFPFHIGPAALAQPNFGIGSMLHVPDIHGVAYVVPTRGAPKLLSSSAAGLSSRTWHAPKRSLLECGQRAERRVHNHPCSYTPHFPRLRRPSGSDRRRARRFLRLLRGLSKVQQLTPTGHWYVSCF
jgi:hypothetical protein